jgi:GTPase
LIGTLVSSILDDGKGSNRTKIAKHKHEIQSGRTSTISSHLIGFDEEGKIIKTSLPNDIAQCAHRTISLMDLAGHEKYLRTTVAGVSRGVADYALVLVSAAQAPTHMTVKHLNLCVSCGIPIIVVLTKADACPAHVFRNTKKRIQDILRSPEIGKRPYGVKTPSDVDLVKDKLHSLAPMIETSCVTGEGLDMLRSMLFSLPKRRQHQKKIDRPFEFLIDETFNVPGVGTVVSGFVNAGQWRKGDTLYIGPLSDGSFIKTSAKSAHVAQTVVDNVWAGHSACFALALTREQRKLIGKRKGMVILDTPAPATRIFTADMCLLKGDPVTMIVGKYETTVHVLHLKKSVKLLKAESLGSGSTVSSSGVVLRPGSRARVTFAFSQGPAYVRKGMRVILRDGHVRGIGVVVSTNPDDV